MASTINTPTTALWCACLVSAGGVGGASCASCASDQAAGPLFGPQAITATAEPLRALEALTGAEFRLAAVSEVARKLLIYAHAGDGRLEVITELEIAAGPRAILERDRGELIIAATSAKQLIVVRDGAVTSSIAIGDAPFHVAALDDALLVTAGLDESARRIEVWTSSGARAADPIAVPGAISAITGDLDGDGDDDALILVPPRGEAVVLEQVAPRRVERRATIATCRDAFSARLADLDADGDLDAVLACRSGGLDVLRAPFSAADHVPGGQVIYDVVLEDFDRDGAIDAAGVDLPGHSVLVWRGAGAGSFSAPESYDVDRGPIALATGDIEGDADVDLIVLAFEARALDVLLHR